MLSLPPIHNHHSTLHITADGQSELTFLEQGDSLCAGEAEGFGCLNKGLVSNGYVVRREAGNYVGRAGCAINDVRAEGSPPLVFYYNMTIVFVEDVAAQVPQLQPISEIGLSFAWVGKTQFNTYAVPTGSDSFAVQQGRWPFSGWVVTNPRVSRHHTHTGHFLYAFLIAATTKDLGIDGPRFLSTSGCDPVKTPVAGFASSAAMVDYMRSQCPSCLSLSAPSSRLFCNATGATATVGSYAYDRRAVLQCGGERRWVERGEAYTAISFFGERPETFFPGPHLALFPHWEKGTFPTHSTWYMWYYLGNDTLSPQLPQSERVYPMEMQDRDSFNTSRCRTPYSDVFYGVPPKRAA